MPGSESSPAQPNQRKLIKAKGVTHTAFPLLVDTLWHFAFGGLLVCQHLEVRARCAGASRIHGSLQRIPLPTKDVVAVLPVSRVVTSAEIQRFLISRPISFVVESGCVPDDLYRLLSETPLASMYLRDSPRA